MAANVNKSMMMTLQYFLNYTNAHYILKQKIVPPVVIDTHIRHQQAPHTSWLYIAGLRACRVVGKVRLFGEALYAPPAAEN